MATINQLVRKPRRSKVTKSNSAALKACPQKRVFFVPSTFVASFARKIWTIVCPRKRFARRQWR